MPRSQRAGAVAFSSHRLSINTLITQLAAMRATMKEERELGSARRLGGELDGEHDWFDLGITVTVEGREVPFSDLFVALAHGQTHLLLSDGAYFSLDKPELAALARLIDEARTLQDQPDGALRISRFQAGLWEELADLGDVGHQAAAWQRQVRGLLDVGQIEDTPIPASICAQLRPYQLSGFQWLAFLWAKNKRK